uniref:Transmembrane protein n=1 Tax=Megaselia scalaris TaxID=36166 RepID=T1GD85_MEGSC
MAWTSPPIKTSDAKEKGRLRTNCNGVRLHHGTCVLCVCRISFVSLMRSVHEPSSFMRSDGIVLGLVMIFLSLFVISTY